MRNITFNNLNFGDQYARTNNFAIQTVQKNVSLRTDIFNKQNNHGWRITKTLASPRLFTFTWKVFWDTVWNFNWKTLLNNALVLDWYHELSWEDDWWTRYKTSAKVYKMPTYKVDRLWIPYESFTFELISEDSEYISSTAYQWSGEVWLEWWITLSTELPVVLGWVIWTITMHNLWNHPAFTKVTVTWEIENPEIRNTTTGKFYKLNTTTTNLIIDNTVSPITAKDNDVNVKQYRVTWSTALILEPWENVMSLVWDNFSLASDITFTIDYNYTYISS